MLIPPLQHDDSQVDNVDWTGLKLLLEGIEPKRVRKRYKMLVRGAESGVVKLREPGRETRRASAWLRAE